MRQIGYGELKRRLGELASRGAVRAGEVRALVLPRLLEAPEAEPALAA